MSDHEFPTDPAPTEIERTEIHVRPRPNPSTENGHAPNGAWDGAGQVNGKAPSSASNFDFLSLGEALLKKWYLILISALLLGGLGVYYGITMWRPSFTATAELMRFEPPGSSEQYKPRALNERAFADMVQ